MYRQRHVERRPKHERMSQPTRQPASESAEHTCHWKIMCADNMFKFYWCCEATKGKRNCKYKHKHLDIHTQVYTQYTNQEKERERKTERRKKFLKYFHSLEFLFEMPQTVSALRVIFSMPICNVHFFYCVRVCVPACLSICLYIDVFVCVCVRCGLFAA